MTDFSRKTVTRRSIPLDDNGVSVQEIVELAKSNRFYEQLSSLMNLDEIIDDFIDIKGARTLANSLKREDIRFEKFDLKSDYHDIESFYGDDNQFYMSFKNITDDNALEIVGQSEFTCLPEYASKNDFFKSLFAMQGFANGLTEKGHSDFVKQTLYALRNLIKRGSHARYYRILKSNDEQGKYYLRATVSHRYNDYSDNIATLLGLIGLYKESSKKGQKFYVQEFSYNESFVNISFSKVENRVLDGIGEIKYVLEVSNDEIKREALKFTSSVTIVYDNHKGGKSELYIKPSEAKWTLLSIKHNSTPTTVINELANISKYINQEEEIYNTMSAINNIPDLNFVRHVVFRTIDNSTTLSHGTKKQAMLSELNSNVETLYQLFDALNKVEYLAEGVEAKEYLRYLFYDALIYQKGTNRKPDDLTKN